MVDAPGGKSQGKLLSGYLICKYPERAFQTNNMGKLLHQKLAQEAVVRLEFEDLQNEFYTFKRQMANVCQKYNINFHEVEASERIAHRGFIAHEAAISLINKCCTCGRDAKTESLSSGASVSSPSPLETPVVLEAVPLPVMLPYQVGWVTWLSFGEATGSSILDAA